MKNKNNNKTTNSTEKLRKCYQCKKTKIRARISRVQQSRGQVATILQAVQ